MGRFDHFGPANPEHDSVVFSKSEARFRTDSSGETTDDVAEFFHKKMKELGDVLGAMKDKTPDKIQEAALLCVRSGMSFRELENLQKAVKNLSGKNLPTIAGVDWKPVVDRAVRMAHEKFRAYLTKQGAASDGNILTELRKKKPN